MFFYIFHFFFSLSLLFCSKINFLIFTLIQLFYPKMFFYHFDFFNKSVKKTCDCICNDEYFDMRKLYRF